MRWNRSTLDEFIKHPEMSCLYQLVRLREYMMTMSAETWSASSMRPHSRTRILDKSAAIGMASWCFLCFRHLVIRRRTTPTALMRWQSLETVFLAQPYFVYEISLPKLSANTCEEIKVQHAETTALWCSSGEALEPLHLGISNINSSPTSWSSWAIWAWELPTVLPVQQAT